MRWSVRRTIVLLVLALLPVAPAVLLFTPAGARVLAELVPRVAPVHIDYAGGSLTGGLHLAQVRVKLADIGIVADDVRLFLDPGCFWNSVLCVRDLQVARLAIDIETGSQDTSPAAPVSEGNELLQFPVALQASGAQLGELRVAWPGGSWQQGAASLDLSLRGSGITVAGARVQNPLLRLTASDTPQTPSRVALPAITLPLVLRVDGLLLQSPTLQLDETTHTLRALELHGQWSRHTLQLARVTTDAGDAGWLELHAAQLELRDDWPLQGGLTLQLGQDMPAAPLDGRSADLRLAGDMGALDVTLSAPGTPSLNGVGRVDVLAPGLPFNASLTLDGLEGLAPPSRMELPEPFALTGLQSPLRVELDGTLDSQRLALTGGAHSAAYGALAVTLDARHTAGTIALQRLDVRDATGDNQFGASGALDLSPALSWTLQCASEGLDLEPLAAQLRGRLAGRFQTRGSAADGRWHLALEDVAVRGDINGAKAHIDGSIALRDGLLESGSDLRADINGARLALRPAADGGSRLELAVADLGRWFGGVDGELALTGKMAAGGGRFEAAGTLSRLRAYGAYVASGSLTAHYARQGEQPFELQLALADISRGDLTLQSLELAARGDLRHQQVVLQSSGDIAGEIAVTGQGNATDWSGSIARTAVQTGKLRWALEQPVPLAWTGATGQLRIAAHCWQGQGLQVCPEEWAIGRQGGGSAQLGGTLSALDPWLPLGTRLQGDAQGSAAAQWDETKGLTAQIQFASAATLLTHELEEGEQDETRWDALEFSASLSNGRLHTDAALYRGQRAKFELALDLPLEAAGSLTGDLRIRQFDVNALSGMLQGSGELGGLLDGELHIGGDLQQPQLDGTLELVDGHASLAGNPTALKDLNLRIEAAGDRARLAGQGLLGGSTLQLQGSLTTRPELALQLHLYGQKHDLLYPPSTELVMSEDLRLSLTPSLLSITGDVTLHSGTFQFEQLPEGAVRVSDNVVRVDTAQGELSGRLPFAVAMDVGVRVDNDFAITGRLVESSLSGDLRLRRLNGQPLQVFGSLNTAGGLVRAYDRVLIIKRGVISFNGDPDNPLVDLRAERYISADDVTAGIRVHGALADNLALDVYSEPLMSQGNAMSYLIWGRGLSAGDTGDGASLALSLASSVVNRSSLVSTINRVPGISDVSFGAEGSGEDTAATVSGYVGERIYLSYGFGIYEPVNMLTARLFLQTRLWLEVVSSLENSVDLYYAFDLE